MNNEGQAMLLTITVVIGALLGTTTVAGFLMVRQIRSSTLSTRSTEAIFVAEAGIEYELYKEFNDSQAKRPVFSNDADFNTSVVRDSDGVVTIKSVGSSGDASRALQFRITPIP